MSVRKLTFLLLAAAALFCGQRKLEAQEYLPVTDPFRFDPDFRWFEPVYDADLADMKPSKRASTGWYGTFDRMHLYFSRPDTDVLREGFENDHNDGFDSGWGNRIRVGYMLESGHGWSSTWFNITGPNAFETLFVERINRINEDELAGPPDDGGDGGGDDGGNFDFYGQYLPSADRNLPGFDERLYELKDSINVVEASSFELNKTWRMEPYHYGGILEPLAGFRYFGIKDRWQEQTYSRFAAVNLAGEDVFRETLLSEGSLTRNHAFGGQLGARYVKFFNRITYSAEFRAFAMHNWQNHRFAIDRIDTDYTALGLGEQPLEEVQSRPFVAYRDNSEFLLGYDIRAEVAYQLTRMFQLRGGFQMIDLSRGIWRGEIDDDTDQRLMMLGATFGAALNF